MVDLAGQPARAGFMAVEHPLPEQVGRNEVFAGKLENFPRSSG